VHVAGIQSPGLASAPAISVDVVRIVEHVLADRGIDSPPNPHFDGTREHRADLSEMSLERRSELIADRPDYGRPLCRCEDVTVGEAIDALRSNLGVRSIDAIKRRTRAGAGRCHGGFCLPRMLRVIQEETGMPLEEIRKKRGQSYLVLGRTKHMRGPVRA
jgi:glycerol-3-phosphate dehydrogenase